MDGRWGPSLWCHSGSGLLHDRSTIGLRCVPAIPYSALLDACLGFRVLSPCEVGLRVEV